MMRNGLSLHPMSLPGGLRPMIMPQTGLNLDGSNGFQNSTCAIASSSNDESLVRHAFSFPKQCSISNKSIGVPSVKNIATSDTSSTFHPSIKVCVQYFNRSISSYIVVMMEKLSCDLGPL